jgi:hypothetical protein
MRSTLGGERKVVGPSGARGRPPVIDDLLVEHEVRVDQVGFCQWSLESRVFDRVTLEGRSDVGCQNGG